MSDTSSRSDKDLASPTELEKPKFIQLHGRIIGSGRLSNRAAVITLAFLTLIIGLIVYGTSQNKISFPRATTDEAAVIPAAQVAPWWQNQSDAVATPKTATTISLSAMRSMDESQSVPDLAQLDSMNSSATTLSPKKGPARSVSVSAQPYSISSFPSIPQLPETVPITSETSSPGKSADADELPEYAKALAAPAVVGVGLDTSVSAPMSSSDSMDTELVSSPSVPQPTKFSTGSDPSRMDHTTPATAYELVAGTTLSAAMITAIDSDSPGTIVAQVSKDVFDSVTGRYLLIPRGARLIGAYDARISYGQERLGVAWARLIFPNGASIDLAEEPGSDLAGRSGFDAQVDQHTRRLFMGAILMSILGAGAQLSQPSQSGNLTAAPSVSQSIAGAVGSQIDEVGTQLAQRQLNVAPNLRVPAGYSFTVIVNRDVAFTGPYAGP
jgi:type IV secretion system protein VirB10